MRHSWPLMVSTSAVNNKLSICKYSPRLIQRTPILPALFDIFTNTSADTLSILLNPDWTDIRFYCKHKKPAQTLEKYLLIPAVFVPAEYRLNDWIKYRQSLSDH